MEGAALEGHEPLVHELLAAVDELGRLGAVLERALRDVRRRRPRRTWPRSAVNAYGIPPFSRIQATATDVSSPPEKAMPMRSPTGSDWRTRLIGASLPRLDRDLRRATLRTAASSSAGLKAPSSRVRITPVPSTTNVNGSLWRFHSSTHRFVPLAGSLSL